MSELTAPAEPTRSQHEIVSEPVIQDYFQGLNGSHNRLYAAGLRTELSDRVWKELPEALGENSELLKTMMGSGKIAVYLHGSAALGVAGESTQGAEDPAERANASDVDMLILVGEHDQYERAYQDEFAQDDADILPSLREEERGWRFLRRSGFADRMGLRGDITIVSVPELLNDIAELDTIGQTGKWPKHAFETMTKVGLALSSPKVLESQDNASAVFRNTILKAILDLKHSRAAWEQVRKIFHQYTVDYEEGAHFRTQKHHSRRVERAFDEVLEARSIPAEEHEQAKEFMRKQRANIDLPEFDQLLALRPHLEAATSDNPNNQKA